MLTSNVAGKSQNPILVPNTSRPKCIETENSVERSTVSNREVKQEVHQVELLECENQENSDIEEPPLKAMKISLPPTATTEINYSQPGIILKKPENQLIQIPIKPSQTVE